jgi:hypothetical protein
VRGVVDRANGGEYGVPARGASAEKMTQRVSPWTESTGEGPGSSLSAPATKDNVAVAGLLAIQAIEIWASSPLDVVLTFGRREPVEPWLTA